MTDQPNIKREVLEYVIKNSDPEEPTAVSLRDLCDERGWEEHRVANAFYELGYALDCGVSPMVPWVAEKEVAEEWFEKWDAEPPENFDNVSWY